MEDGSRPTNDRPPQDRHRDGVSERPSGRQQTGESGGGDYPRTGDDPPPDNDFSSFMGHGGQSEQRYYGPDHEREKHRPDPDRNADLQGQGSPIRDDAGPPEQGWRGERSDDAATDRPDLRRQIRAPDGHVIEVEESSGVPFAEIERCAGSKTHD